MPAPVGPRKRGTTDRRAGCGKSARPVRREGEPKGSPYPYPVGQTVPPAIDCDLCRQTAPDFFDRNAEKGYSYVSKQPATPEEIALCQQAVDECPVEAIGNDGN